MNLEKILKFECLIAPTVIIAFTYMISLAAIVVGIMDIKQGNIPLGVQKIIFIPLFLRVIAEFVLVVFQNNAELKKSNKPTDC